MRTHATVVILSTLLCGVGTAALGGVGSELGETEVSTQVNPMDALLGPMVEDDTTDGSGGLVFLRAAGSNLTPRDSTTSYSYSGAGCTQRNSNNGDSWFTMDVQVPDGAVLDFLRVYYYDNSVGSDVNAELWAFDAAGGTTQIAEADSTGTGGYGTAGSGFFSHTVSNLDESLVVLTSIQGGVGSSLQACGVRLRYQLPQ